MQFTIANPTDLTYGSSIGSARLQRALASYLNSQFQPLEPVCADSIAIGPGVTGLIDTITWNICNEGDGIIIPRPLYNSFPRDIEFRSKGKLIPASFVWDNETYSMDSAFDAAANRAALERAYNNATSAGIKVRGVIITK